MKHKHCDLIKKWADGAEIQYYHNKHGWSDVALNTPSWSVNTEYRVKPIEFSWDIIHPQWKYLAQDADGTWWAYIDKPSYGNFRWDNEGGNIELSKEILLLPSVDWKDSLICRE